MSANIDLSASKGSIPHTNTACLWNTNYPPRSLRRVLLQAFSHMRRAKAAGK